MNVIVVRYFSVKNTLDIEQEKFKVLDLNKKYFNDKYHILFLGLLFLNESKQIY